MLTFSTSLWTAPELRPILSSPRSGRPKHRRAWAAVRTLRRMSKDWKAGIIRNPWNSIENPFENIMVQWVQCPINLGCHYSLWHSLTRPLAFCHFRRKRPAALIPVAQAMPTVASAGSVTHRWWSPENWKLSGSSQYRSSRCASQIGLNGMSQNQVKPGIEPNPKKRIKYYDILW